MQTCNELKGLLDLENQENLDLMHLLFEFMYIFGILYSVFIKYDVLGSVYYTVLNLVL